MCALAKLVTIASMSLMLTVCDKDDDKPEPVPVPAGDPDPTPEPRPGYGAVSIDAPDAKHRELTIELTSGLANPNPEPEGWEAWEQWWTWFNRVQLYSLQTTIKRVAVSEGEEFIDAMVNNVPADLGKGTFSINISVPEGVYTHVLIIFDKTYVMQRAGWECMKYTIVLPQDVGYIFTTDSAETQQTFELSPLSSAYLGPAVLPQSLHEAATVPHFQLLTGAIEVAKGGNQRLVIKLRPDHRDEIAPAESCDHPYDLRWGASMILSTYDTLKTRLIENFQQRLLEMRFIHWETAYYDITYETPILLQ